MKKSMKKMIAIGMMATIIALQATSVSAETRNAKIGGVGFAAFSKITSSSATSGTVSSSPYLKATVSSTYSYVHPDTLKTGKTSNSKTATAAATLSFSAPKGYRSVKISSTNKAVANGETWTSNTSAKY